MKYKLSIIIALTSISCAVAQPTQYTSKNKKAIKAFQEGEACYNKIDMQGKKDNACIEKNYTKAFEIDPAFMEAYLMLSQHYMDTRQNDKAIEILKKSHQQNPTFFVNSWFLLGELLYKQGKYEEAAATMDEYLRYTRGRVPQDMQADLDRIKQSCAFAIEAMKHPIKLNLVNVGPGINTQYPEYFPTITGDDQMLLFTRRLPDEAAPMGEQEDFFYSLWEDGKWGKSRSISTSINTILNEGAPSLSNDGEVLIFTACDLMGGGDYGPNREGFGSCDLFYSQKYNGSWTRAINMGGNINSANWETQPSYSADGRTLYYIRGRKGGGSGNHSGDIVMSTLNNNGEWSTPVKLPNYINTDKDEASVLIHPDGQTLYFASNGHIGMGGYDLYMCRMQPDGTWGKPVNLGYPLNTNSDENSLLVSSKGTVAFLASDRPGGYGELDLYMFDLDESIRPVYTTYMKGVVYDSTTKAKLEARFEMYDMETGKLIQASASNQNGEFFQNIATNKKYLLSVEKKEYISYRTSFIFGDDGVPRDRVFNLNVPLVPLKDAVEKPFVLNVFFDVDKSELKKESFVELEKLITFLNSHPTFKIELRGHTDSDGDDAHNLKLSQDRANAVMDYLVSKGIAKERLKAKGFGETMPVVPNTSKENKAKNRRTEYVILK